MENRPNQQQATTSSSSSSSLQDNPSLLRRVLSSASATDVYELLLQQQESSSHSVQASDVELLLRCSLEAANVDLALSIYQQLCAAKRAQAAGGTPAASTWPAATLQHTETLVKGLCKQLRVNDALAAVRSIRSQGVPGSEEVCMAHTAVVRRCMMAVSMVLLAGCCVHVADSSDMLCIELLCSQ